MFFLSQKQRDQMKEELKHVQTTLEYSLILKKWGDISDQQKKDIGK